MPCFNQIQDRHSILDSSSIPYESFYIADPPVKPDSILYQLNRAGSLQQFPSKFLVRRDIAYPFSALMCITGGSGTIIIEQQRCTFTSGQILLLPPYTSYEYSSDPLHPFSCVWAEFCGGDSERFVHHLMVHNGPIFTTPVFDEMTKLCMSLAHPEPNHRMTWISKRIYESFLLLNDACCYCISQKQETICEVLDYIDQHLQDNLTLSSLSQLFGYNSTYFSKFFLRHTGFHFARYLLRRRVERARQLLLSTNLPLEQMAQQLGFYDASHFIRKFKEIEGVSPSRYRRNHLHSVPEPEEKI